MKSSTVRFSGRIGDDRVCRELVFEDLKLWGFYHLMRDYQVIFIHEPRKSFWEQLAVSGDITWGKTVMSLQKHPQVLRNTRRFFVKNFHLYAILSELCVKCVPFVHVFHRYLSKWKSYHCGRKRAVLQHEMLWQISPMGNWRRVCGALCKNYL